MLRPNAQAKTTDEIFREWLATATIEELEEEHATLTEANIQILSQIEEYEMRTKTKPATPDSEDWRLRAGHSQRRAYYQMKAIEKKLKTIENQANAAKNMEYKMRCLALEEAKLKLKAEQGPLEYLKQQNTRKATEIIAENRRRKRLHALSYDEKWIRAAKGLLDADTFRRITALADTAPDELTTAPIDLLTPEELK